MPTKFYLVNTLGGRIDHERYFDREADAIRFVRGLEKRASVDYICVTVYYFKNFGDLWWMQSDFYENSLARSESSEFKEGLPQFNPELQHKEMAVRY
jgi:hypothetical protein